MRTITVADLVFSEQANHNFSKTLGELKRYGLSIYNRLKSIQEDAAFALKVAETYGRPLIANERCGSWYIHPKDKAGSAYFKSTDGHTGVWKFSSRRLNLHLLHIIGEKDGCIVVDSTRRGKRMPDSLSKTIPIWCSVVNRFLFPENEELHELYTPPQTISEVERVQIKQLLPTFLAALHALHISPDVLRRQISKPLRPFWVTPDSQVSRTEVIFKDFHPIICCTVSRRVSGGELSEGGYIQGAGDDTENWAFGLTAPLFWMNDALLLSTPEDDMPEVIGTLIRQNSIVSGTLMCVKPTASIFVGPLSALNTAASAPSITLLPEVISESQWIVSRTSLEIGLGPHKIGSRALRTALPTIVRFAESTLLQNGSDNPPSIVLVCESGKDLAVGAALALLCLFFRDDGALRDISVEKSHIDKNYIRRRLGWLSTSMPDANPSRATLQSVNSFLMERP